jgi:hypothetical protein
MKAIAIFRSNLDMLGMGMSILCVVHCLTFPLLLAFAPQWMRWLPGDDLTHRSLVVVVGLLGIFAFRRGYRIHRQSWLLILFLVGVVLILIAAICGEALLSERGEAVMTVCGSICIVTAHFFNHRCCRACTCCSTS